MATITEETPEEIQEQDFSGDDRSEVTTSPTPSKEAPEEEGEHQEELPDNPDKGQVEEASQALAPPSHEGQENECHLLRRQLAALHAEYLSFQQRLEREARSREQLRASAAEAWRQVDQAEGQVRQLQEEVEEARQESQFWAGDAAHCKSQRDEARASQQRTQTELRTLQEAHKQTQQDHQVTQVRLGETLERVDQLSSENCQLRSRVTRMGELMRELEERAASAEAHHKEAKEEVIHLRREARACPGPQTWSTLGEAQDLEHQSGEYFSPSHGRTCACPPAHPSGASMDPGRHPLHRGGTSPVQQPHVMASGVPSTGIQPEVTTIRTQVTTPAMAMAPAPGVGAPSQVPAQGVHVPMPRQMEYDGSSVSFEGFMGSFMAAARMAGWSDDVKLYRLQASLRGEALEYFTQQVTDAEGQSFNLAVEALRSRFQEKKATATYLAQLKARQLQPKEDVSHYIAELKKLVVRAYPSADHEVRDTIVLQQFLQGLQDPQASLQIGMLQPKTLEEARAAYETYFSLKDDAPRPPRVRATQPEQGDTSSVLMAEFSKLANEIRSAFQGLQAPLQQGQQQGFGQQVADTRPKEIRSAEHQGESRTPRQRRQLSDVQCFSCQEYGHYKRRCPYRQQEAAANGSTPSSQQQEN